MSHCQEIVNCSKMVENKLNTLFSNMIIRKKDDNKAYFIFR